MKKYFISQLKRQFRALPLVLAVIAVLSGALGLIFRSIMGVLETSDENTRLRIAVVGAEGSPILEAGLSALAGMDSSRYYFELETMDEAQAVQEMKDGTLPAYIVIPPDFLREAMYGNIIPLKYVSTESPVGISAVVKAEITQVISDMVLSAQKGIYGTWDAMDSQGLHEQIGSEVDGIALALTEYAFDRDGTYTVTQLGISDGLRFSEYLFCGLSVLFLMLAALPFSLNLVDRNDSLRELLASGGLGGFRQTLCEYGAYTLIYGFLVYLLLGIGALAAGIPGKRILMTALRLIPAVLAITGLSFLVYSLSEHIVAGLVGMLFGTLVLCFLGGCLYPAYFFPGEIQDLGAVLPTSLCREQIASCLTGSSGRTWPLLSMTGAFLGLSWLLPQIRSAVGKR